MCDSVGRMWKGAHSGEGGGSRLQALWALALSPLSLGVGSEGSAVLRIS